MNCRRGSHFLYIFLLQITKAYINIITFACLLNLIIIIIMINFKYWYTIVKYKNKDIFKVFPRRKIKEYIWESDMSIWKSRITKIFVKKPIFSPFNSPLSLNIINLYNCPFIVLNIINLYNNSPFSFKYY